MCGELVAAPVGVSTLQELIQRTQGLHSPTIALEHMRDSGSEPELLRSARPLSNEVWCAQTEAVVKAASVGETSQDVVRPILDVLCARRQAPLQFPRKPSMRFRDRLRQLVRGPDPSAILTREKEYPNLQRDLWRIRPSVDVLQATPWLADLRQRLKYAEAFVEGVREIVTRFQDARADGPATWEQWLYDVDNFLREEFGTSDLATRVFVITVLDRYLMSVPPAMSVDEVVHALKLQKSREAKETRSSLKEDRQPQEKPLKRSDADVSRSPSNLKRSAGDAPAIREREVPDTQRLVEARAKILSSPDVDLATLNATEL